MTGAVLDAHGIQHLSRVLRNLTLNLCATKTGSATPNAQNSREEEVRSETNVHLRFLFSAPIGNGADTTKQASPSRTRKHGIKTRLEIEKEKEAW